MRVEFKAAWHPETTGPQVLKTICAFANDYHDLNGGYVVIGIAERDGRASLPPAGLSSAELAVPWDDRRALGAGLADLHEMTVREHLHEIGGGLTDESDAVEIYRRMVAWASPTRVNDHDVPRNVGLLFFAAEPTRWFRGAWVDCALFAAGGTGDVQEEQEFRGGLTRQLRNCLQYLHGRSPVHLRKKPPAPQYRSSVFSRTTSKLMSSGPASLSGQNRRRVHTERDRSSPPGASWHAWRHAGWHNRPRPSTVAPVQPRESAMMNGFAFDRALERLAMHPSIWPIVKALTRGRSRLVTGMLWGHGHPAAPEAA